MRFANLALSRLYVSHIVVNCKYCAIYLDGCGKSHRGNVNGPSGKACCGNSKCRGLQNTGSVPFLHVNPLERGILTYAHFISWPKGSQSKKSARRWRFRPGYSNILIFAFPTCNESYHCAIYILQAAEVESQRQRLHSTQQAILQAKEQLRQKAEKQHTQRVTYLQEHLSVAQLQDLQKHLHSELSTATHNTTSNDPTNTTIPTTTHRSVQLQRTLATVAEALTFAEAIALRAAQEQQQQQAAALALAQAQAEAEAEADALATARANELANSALHGDDVFPFDLADEIHSIGPPKSASDPLPAVVPGATFDTVTSTITCSNMTSTFQSPAETFPVSYAAGSSTGLLEESAVLTETVVPVAVSAKVTKTAKAKGKRKATQSAEPLQQDSSPPATQVVGNIFHYTHTRYDLAILFQYTGGSTFFNTDHGWSHALGALAADRIA